MPKIAYKGTYLELVDPQITTRFVNNAFSDESFDGDFSWSFNIKWTPHNRRILQVDLNHFNLLEKSWDVVYDLAGQSYAAKLIPQEVNQERLKCNLQLNFLSLDQFQENLRDMSWDFEVTSYDTKNNPEQFLNATWPNKPFCFPSIINPLFAGEDQDNDYGGVINAYSDGDAQYLRNTVTSGVADNSQALVPMPFLGFLITEGFKKMALAVRGTFLTHPDVRKIFLYANREIMSGDNEQSWGYHTPTQTVQADQSELIAFDASSLGNWNTSQDKYVAPADGQYGIIFQATIENSTQPTDLALIVEVNGIFKASIEFPDIYQQGATGTVAFSSSSLGFNQNDDVTFSLDSLNGNGDLTFSDLSIELKLQPQSIANAAYELFTFPADGLPDVTFGELLKFLKIRFGLIFTYDKERRQVYINWRQDLFDQAGQEFPGQIEKFLEKSYDQRKSFSLAESLSDDAFTKDQEFFGEREKIELGKVTTRNRNRKMKVDNEIELQPMPLLWNSVPPAGGYPTGRLDEEGTSPFYNLSNAPELRIAFYDRDAGITPVALNIKQSELSLDHDHPPYTWLVNWYKFLSLQAEIEIRALMKDHELRQLKVDGLYRVDDTPILIKHYEAKSVMNYHRVKVIAVKL